MKISKSKLAAASFGAALTSLYAAPELCAQEDTIDSTAELSFDPGVVPFFSGMGEYDYGVNVAVNGIPDTNGLPDNLVVNVGNNGDPDYGFGVANNYLGSRFPGGADSFFELSPGDVFDGRSGDGVDSLLNIGGVGATGVQTIGFVTGLGQVGYFRVDLGLGNGPALFLDGEVAAADENGMNDFTITIPDGDEPFVLRGDVNLDGMVNFLDIAPFISRLAEMENQPEADVNEDGVVNFLDISPFIGVLANPSSMQVSWTDSTGKPLERFAAGNEVLEKQLQAIERKLQEELNTALAQTNGSAVEPKSASVGLAALALGAAGLRRRRNAVVTA